MVTPDPRALLIPLVLGLYFLGRTDIALLIAALSLLAAGVLLARRARRHNADEADEALPCEH